MSEYGNVAKIAILFSAGSLVAFGTLVSLEKLTLVEGAICAGAALLYCLLVAVPCVSDLRALRRYVTDLAEDKEAETPPLSMLSNIETLPEAVQNLQRNWRKHSEKLETTLQKNFVIFHSLPAPVLVLSANGLVLNGNRNARTLFKSELMGKNLESVISDARLLRACKQLRGRDERLSQIEVEIDDNIHYFECILHPISAQEMARQSREARMNYSRESTICLLYDVSNIVKTQEAMRDFVANASHEIQTPLTGIVGFLESMLEEDFPRDSEYFEKFLRICLERSYALSSLARDLLSLAKIEISAQDVFNDRVNVAALATAATNLYRNDSILHNKNMSLTASIAKDIPDFYGNATELQLMFSNLLSNAVKYGASDGAVEVKVVLYKDSDEEIANLLINTDRNAPLHYAERYVMFSVRNDGEIIPEEKIPRLTERFYRVDSSRGDGVGGSGIGLSIVKSIAEHHHGILQILSDADNGNLFRVFFPVIESPSAGNIER